MDSINLGHFFLKKAIHKSVPCRLGFTLERVRDDFEAEVGLDGVGAAAHGRVVGVFGGVVVDGKDGGLEGGLDLVDNGLGYGPAVDVASDGGVGWGGGRHEVEKRGSAADTGKGGTPRQRAEHS